MIEPMVPVRTHARRITKDQRALVEKMLKERESKRHSLTYIAKAAGVSIDTVRVILNPALKKDKADYQRDRRQTAGEGALAAHLGLESTQNIETPKSINKKEDQVMLSSTPNTSESFQNLKRMVESTAVPQGKLLVYEVFITPDMAKDFLKRNTRNRRVKASRVKEYARRILGEQWKLNGETIIFDCMGVLNNGQHRLQGIVAADTGIWCLVVLGVDEDAFQTMDEPVKRNMADSLDILGESNSKILVAATRYIDGYYRNSLRNHVVYSNAEAKPLLDKYSQVRYSASVCGDMRGIMPSTIMAACHYLFSTTDPEKADEFVKALRTGVGLDAGSPILALREKLQKNARSVNKGKLPAFVIIALTIKAWNLWKRGKTCTYLQFISDGPLAEAFPKVL